MAGLGRTFSNEMERLCLALRPLGSLSRGPLGAPPTVTSGKKFDEVRGATPPTD